jgi:hypothetical protein
VHIPLALNSSEHQVRARRQDGIRAALKAFDAHGRRMRALVALLDQWDRFPTPVGCVGQCAEQAGPTMDHLAFDGAIVGRLVEFLRSGNRQIDQLADLLARELVVSTAPRRC